MKTKARILRALNDINPSIFDFRYEVGTEHWQEYFARFDEALECALRHENGTHIFDRCAHRGRPQLWQIHNGYAEIREVRP